VEENQSGAISREPDSKDNLVNIFYLRPMVGNDLLEKSEYDVEMKSGLMVPQIIK